MEEVAFPRGNTKSLSDGPRDKDKNRRKEDDLFKLDVTKKRKKKKTKSGTQDEHPSKKANIGFYVDTNADVIEPLSAQILTQGMLILGCVLRIRKYEIWVSLPGALVGTVPIMEISDSYTTLLKKFAESESQDDSIKKPPEPLKNLFTIGTYVICKVKEISTGLKPHITLTLNPRELHDDITQYVLYHGMVLTAAVASAEDHGYVMDVGVRGLTAFLKHDKCLGRNTKKGQKLFVGQLLLCSIDMPGTDFKTTVVRSLDLNARPNVVSKSQTDDVSMRAMLPGTKVSASILKVMKSGVFVRVAANKGVVLKQHLSDPFQTVETLEMQENVKGRILCMHPITKSLYVSLQKRIVNLFPTELLGGLRYGDIVDEAEVVEVIKGSVLFRLTKGVKGIAPPSKLPVKKTEITEAFPVGSVHRCMVRRLRPMDNVVMVSVKTDDINNIVLHLEDVKPGDLVQCTILDYQSQGMGVRLRGGIRGFIPTAYITDKPVNNLRKSFKLNTNLSCRVLKVNKERNLLILTSRESIINSTSPVVATYEDARPNMVVEGCVESISDRYILVAFYNKVKGIVLINDIEMDSSSLSEAFKPGQLVKCTVLTSNAKTSKMRLSLKNIAASKSEEESSSPHNKTPVVKNITTSKSEEESSSPQNKTPVVKIAKLLKSEERSSVPRNDNFPLGEIVSCKVSRISPSGLDVVILPSGTPAFLPVLHLSDHLSNCPILLKTYSPEDIIDPVLCFSNISQPIVTMKPIFIEWVKKEKAVSSIDDFKMGMLVPLTVRHFAQFGVFVELLYGLTALIPNRCLSNNYSTDSSTCGLKFQQSVIGEVEKVHEAEGKVEFNILPINALATQLEKRIDHLTVFLDEQEHVRQHFLNHGEEKLKSLASQRVGSVVDFTVKIVSAHGAIGTVGDEIKALVTKEHSWTKQVEVGQTVKAVILAQDFSDCCLDLVIDELVVDAVVSTLEKSSTTPATFSGTTTAACKGVIVMVKEDYMLALIHHRGLNRFAFLPTKKHFNYVPNMANLPKYGEECFIILKGVSEYGCLGILATAEAAEMRRMKQSFDVKYHRAPISFVPLTTKKVAKSGQGLKRLKQKPGKKKRNTKKAKNSKSKSATSPGKKLFRKKRRSSSVVVKNNGSET